MDEKDQKLEKLVINYTGYSTRLSKKFLERKPYVPVDKTKVVSFIPGTIFEIYVRVGDVVAEGDSLLVLEAMKMKNTMKSPVAATVKSIEVSVGDRVPKGLLLVELERHNVEEE
ncbi:MAG: acetyl-CoA carboxylase biotin carboxyl carrier protein subunit [Bacteroidales bacterium]